MDAGFHAKLHAFGFLTCAFASEGGWALDVLARNSDCEWSTRIFSLCNYQIPLFACDKSTNTVAVNI